MKLVLFPTCVIDAVKPDAGVATARLLRRLGHEVIVPADATCCGQPAWNAGQAPAAARVARTTIHAVADAIEAQAADAVVVPAGSCATMMRVFWAELLHVAHEDERTGAKARAVAEKTFELSEFLVRHGGLPADGTTAVPGRDGTVVYHRSCHMLRELRITSEPEDLLDAAGAARVDTTASGRCCGFGGLFSVKLPETSTAMADDVLDAAVEAGATEVVGCDASCLMHLEGRSQRRELPLQFRHLAEALEGRRPV